MTPPPPAEVEAAVRRIFAAPRYDWTPPSEGEQWLVRTARALGDWLEMLGQLHPWAIRAVFGVCVLLLAVIVAHGAVTALRMVRDAGAPADRRRVPRPAGPAADVSREASERLAAADRFAEAMLVRWLAYDDAVRRAGLVAVPGALTPRELAALLPETDRTPVQPLVRALYASVFAGRPTGAADWTVWRDALEARWPEVPRGA